VRGGVFGFLVILFSVAYRKTRPVERTIPSLATTYFNNSAARCLLPTMSPGAMQEHRAGRSRFSLVRANSTSHAPFRPSSPYERVRALLSEKWHRRGHRFDHNLRISKDSSHPQMRAAAHFSSGDLLLTHRSCLDRFGIRLHLLNASSHRAFQLFW